MTPRHSGRVATLSVSRLTVRLVIVLSLAILPLGLISIYQSWRMMQESQILSKASLLDRTRQAIHEERRLIEHSFGAAEALTGAAIALGPGTAECDFPFARMVASDWMFSFAAFVGETGDILCASNGMRKSIAGTAFFDDALAETVPAVHTRPNVADDGRSVFSLTLPVNETGSRGFVWIAIPADEANRMLAEDSGMVDLVLFGGGGEILATEDFADDRRDVLPAERALADLPRPAGYTFRGHNRRGETRDFAVVPMVEHTIYALGSWPPAKAGVPATPWRNMGLYLPALIWLTSILVAAIGLHRMVIRHISRLRHWMRLYSDHRDGFETAQLDRAPEELEAVARTFRTMTARIAEQERQREEDIEEKTALLREVHHRVKNNLQVISSIMNMKARNARSPETRAVIRRLQGRIMALASIHRRLYMSRRLSTIRADELFRDIVHNLETVAEGSGGAPLRITTHFDPVPIVPEQSMPLSLLVTEAATNAMKHCSAPAGGTPWIDMALKEQGDGRVSLSVVNSWAPGGAEDEPDLGQAGLGIGLIETFTSQLEGTLEHRRLADRYELHVSFVLMRPGEWRDEDEGEDAGEPGAGEDSAA